MLFSLLFAACTKNEKDGSQEKTADTTISKGTENTENTENTTEKRIKLSLFMMDGGMAIPAGISPSDNRFINVVKEYANVDLDVEVPPWNDFTTKFKLMLSSSTLPDIVVTYINDEAEKAGDAGAFIDLLEYYNSSSVVQKIITPEMMELAKSGSGKNYRIPTRNNFGAKGQGVIVREDLVMKYNNNKWPESVDEWVALMRTIKKADPKFIGISAHNGFFDYGAPLFWWYGVPVEWGKNGTSVRNGEYVANFTLPEYRAVIELSRQLYAEGIIDPEFSTNDQPTRQSKQVTNNTLLGTDWADQLPGLNAYYKTKLNAGDDFLLVYAPNLKVYPKEVKDVKYTYGRKQAEVYPHGTYISTSCKNPDRAWKVIEGLCSEEMLDAIFWGNEGETYKVVDGNRVPDTEKMADPNFVFGLGLAFGVGYGAGLDVRYATYKSQTGQEIFDKELASAKILDDNAKIAGIRIVDFLKAENDEEKEADKKAAEAFEFEKAASIKAIMGQITMADFDKQVEEFKSRYGFIFEAYTKYIQRHKDDLISKGILEAGW